MTSRGTGRHKSPGTAAALLAAAAIVAACSITTISTPPVTTSAPSSTTGLSTTSTTAPSIPTKATLAWHACNTRFRCASLRVPISYANPSEGTIKIAVIELLSTGSQKTARDLVMNPGGPGASGLGFLEQTWSAFPSTLRQTFNLVSFDPRGVGQSAPVVCLTPAGLRQWIGVQPAPGTPAQISQVETAAKAFVATCAKSQPADVLANLSTAVTAHDLDRLRAALGQPRLDYLGFSYGTYLGALYAQAFPENVGALVLDGAIDPSLTTAEIDVQQAQGFEVDLHDFFTWCATNSSCTSELPDASADYSEFIGEVKRHDILAKLSTSLGGNQMIGYPVALEGIFSTLYTINAWPTLAQAIADGLQGDGTLVTELAYSFAGFNQDGTVSNELSGEMAVLCLDRPVPALSDYPKLASQFGAQAPDFGAPEAWGTLPCNFWPEPPTGKPMKVHLTQALHVLVVGSTHDPATPYAWSKSLAEQVDGAVLLTRTGDGHTGYFSSSCVRSWVDGFLISLDTPPKGTACASD